MMIFRPLINSQVHKTFAFWMINSASIHNVSTLFLSGDREKNQNKSFPFSWLYISLTNGSMSHVWLRSRQHQPSRWVVDDIASLAQPPLLHSRSLRSTDQITPRARWIESFSWNSSYTLWENPLTVPLHRVSGPVMQKLCGGGLPSCIPGRKKGPWRYLPLRDRPMKNLEAYFWKKTYSFNLQAIWRSVRRLRKVDGCQEENHLRMLLQEYSEVLASLAVGIMSNMLKFVTGQG